MNWNRSTVERGPTAVSAFLQHENAQQPAVTAQSTSDRQVDVLRAAVPALASGLSHRSLVAPVASVTRTGTRPITPKSAPCSSSALALRVHNR